MTPVLNDDDLSEVASEFFAVATDEDADERESNSSKTKGFEQKINKLNDVRERLQELRGIVSNYETGAQQSVQETINSSKDNRLQAQSMREQQKQANTLTGVGGARLRVQPNANNQDVILNDLMTLQASIEELMDNRNRPMPQGIQRNKIDVTRNAPLKNKNTNQEQKQSNQAVDYAEQLRVLNNARKQFSNLERAAANLKKKNNQRAMENSEVVSEQETDAESTLSALQWQDDPEFQTKVKKLKMAREKLHHLQELVKVVQQGGGPHLPIDDLEDLTLELSEDIEESEYGESEEEGEDTEGDDENEEEELETEEQGSGEDDDQSDISKSTNDINCNFASENGLSDNERRYQGLLRKQRLELNYLLKERERLLQAQRQLSDLAANESEEDEPVQPKKKNSAKKKQKIDYPKLTKAQLRKQQGKSSSKENTMRRLFPKLSSTDAAQGFYAGSEHEIYPAEQAPSDSKAPMLASTTNPMAVSEIRRQRDLFEERKRQKFVEKQRRKKQNRQVQNDENQSEDRATYVINSDIDEGVGVSMYSADVTTAATWGGSTEQSSDEEDSAVGDEEAGVDDDFDQYDQAEEEEEEADSRHPPRGGAAVGNIVQSVLFKDVGDEDEEEPRQKKKNRGIGSVSWSMDVSPPRSRKRPRQGNLTPAHKLIQDNNTKRKQFLKQQQQQQEQQQRKTLPKASPLRPQSTQSNTSAIRQQYRSLSQSSAQPSEDVQSQLATICSSLLRNEQTLLQMLQNQMGQQTVSAEAPCLSSVNARANAGMNQNVLSEIQDFFTSSNYNQSYQETLDALRSTYERIEQHQLDMEFLRQQFEKLNQAPAPSSAAANARALRSPWPNPPSLHFSAFGGDRTSSAADKPLFQKETQTETSLFGEPFKPSAQQYSLFGESGAEGASAADNQPQDDFPFNPVIVDPTSPGVVGDRAQQKERADDETLTMFPYRLRVSEYNPLSYQGNFANTRTGNTMTISKMSMTKKNEEDSTQNKADEKDGKNIWPSFFKMTDDETGTQASKDATPSKKNGAAAKTASASSSPNKSGKEADESEENATLFEALRDTIYSEVATLIAMNESRPHYLIELFRELQLLNSDYLRQRALYSLQELVTRYLTEENIPPQSSSNVSPSKGTAFTKETLAGQDWIASASEQTPSDLASVVTTTDDEGESQALRTLAQQIQNNEMYDYAELADSQSEANLSTPGSHHDIPFAAEDLGNTVINLEDALQKMRTYEQNMAEAKRAFQEISSNVRESTPSSAANQKEAYETIKRRLNAMETASTSSAGDVASETSSDAPQPSVDTHKLDQQIKAVMVDLIPFLNENIDKTCNEDFLDLIRRLIVEFAKEKEPGSENEQFGRFFHSQLDSILRDSLMKFNGRKLKECGEDILIDVSEILFNELAFFKLMQDLDRPLFGAISAEYTSQNQNEHSKMPFAGPTTMYDDSSAAESTDAAGVEQTETDCDDPIESDQGSPVVPKPSNSSATSGGSFVMIDQITDEDEEIEGVESGRHFVKVELSVSETRPFRSSGSGEEDGNEEEPVTFSTAAAPESSINTYSQALQNNIVTAEPVRGEDLDAMVEDDRDEGDQQENARRDVQEEVEGSASGQDDVDADPENERAEDQRDLESSDLAEPESNMALSSGQNESRQEADRHEQTESNRQQQELEEASAEDDLPEADMVSDDNNMNAAEAAHVVLAHMQDQPELAGDGNTLPVPSGQ